MAKSVCLLVMLLCAADCSGQRMVAIRASGAASERVTAIPSSLRTEANDELYASFKARLGPFAKAVQGEAWFTFTAEFRSDGGRTERIVGRVPIASTGDAYGESRACVVGKDGSHELTFTAGLDEANFVDFHSQRAETRSYSFLLNKYLCRMLAAPFRCGGSTLALPSSSHEMKRWRVVSVALALKADRPGVMMASPVTVERRPVAFDYERCAKVAPSNGLCCVQGRTTEWSCGVPPADGGWHKVSGDCFHRETGGSCRE